MQTAIIICVYNNPEGLLKTLASIAGEQGDFAVLVVDDGSPVPILINSEHYPFPVHLRRLPQNAGIAHASNAGVQFAHEMGAEYITRIDAGDEWVPGRLAQQAQVLNENSGIVVVGCRGLAVYPDGTPGDEICHPATHAEIMRFMHINAPFVNVSAMMRLSAVRVAGGYPVHYPAAEDYALFWRLLRAGQGRNLDILGVRFEYANPHSISNKKFIMQQISRLRLQLENFNAREPKSYEGVLRTLLSIALPRKTLKWIKSFFGYRGANLRAAD